MRGDGQPPDPCRSRYRSAALVLGFALLTGDPCAAAAQSAGNQSPGAPAPAPPLSAPEPEPEPEPDPKYPRISLGTLTYLQYAAELKNRDGFNAFDLTRGYINITGDITKNVKFRLTPDFKRVDDGSLSGSLVFRLKYGYVELHELTPKGWLRFGLHQTPWLDFEESINRYRVQGTMFAEREGVIPGSGDFGAGYLARLPSGYGEINVGVYNGEGFTHAEVDKRKSVQARLTIRPLAHLDPAGDRAKGLRLSAFYDAGWYAKDRPRRHGIVMVSYDHSHFVGTAQWLAGTMRPPPFSVDTDFRGYSVFGEVRQGKEGWAGTARFDRFDPNDRVSGNAHRRTIAGVAYWLAWSSARIGLVVNDEDVRYDGAAGRPNENRVLFQTHVQF